MIAGPFNVNSTSVSAWKQVLSSLRGKPVARLEDTPELAEDTPQGTPIGSGMLPNGELVESGDLNFDPNSPPNQWTGWRDLTDEEIDTLAEAMVHQVKQRGPFLSLSEFVNRRLDASNAELSVKGAMQAALDDPFVPINAAFRHSFRALDNEQHGMTPEFPEALEGPVAYGSAPYIDQADILRHLAGQLTTRGDTFIIRAYGDSLNSKGNVEARAWCEAVIQRTPEYIDSADEPHIKQHYLTSQTNLKFGRRFELVSFRWLHPSEV